MRPCVSEYRRKVWPGETLVAMTPKTAAQLIALGYEVVVEAGAGAAAKFADEAYEAAGATIGTADEVWASDVVAQGQRAEPGRDRPAERGRGRCWPGWAWAISRSCSRR